MTLTDIKNKIVEQLNQLTIDDFYADPGISIAKQTFSELTKLNSDTEIENFLSGRFPETTAETLRAKLKQSITNLKKKISNIEGLIQTSQSKIEALNTQLSQKKELQTDIPKQENQLKSELTDIEVEIKQIKPLVGKSPYNKKMEALEKKKEKKNKELEKYPGLILKLKGELEGFKTNIRSEKEIIAQKESEIRSIQKEILVIENSLVELSEKENTYFKVEYASLEFLFKILLHKEIYVGNDRKTGEQILESNNCSFDKICQFTLPFINSENIIPKDWRSILFITLSNPIPKIAGSISEITFERAVYFNREYSELTPIDTSFLLATKIALSSGHTIQTADNKIIICLTGGMSATLSFRKKGKLISKFQQKPFELFSKYTRGENYLEQVQYVFQTLYYHTGYANSEIKIKAPHAFYILTEGYVIEIAYHPAPILFDNSFGKYAPNISAKAKHEDEIAEEEERRRQQEEDDY